LEGVALGMRLGNGRVCGLGEGCILKAERVDDLFTVQITNGLVCHLLEDQTKQHVVRVGVEPPGTWFEQRGLLDAGARQLFGSPNPRRVGQPFLHPLLVLRVAGDPAGHVGHLAQRDPIPVWDTFDVAVDRVVERKEPLVRGLEKQGGGEGLGDAAFPVVHLGRHRLPGALR
jgi:hypothetical protein